MLNKFRNKYRISTTRLPEWDYGSNGAYFITICSKNRFHYFGSINNGEVILSPIGRIVEKEWNKTPLMRPELNLLMDDFVIMPDHIHGIIIRRDARPCASTRHIQKNKFGAQCNNIPSIIRGFKSAVTIQSRKINPQFSWQGRYYDRVIRNRNEYLRIVKYIEDNPREYDCKGKSPPTLKLRRPKPGEA